MSFRGTVLVNMHHAPAEAYQQVMDEHVDCARLQFTANKPTELITTVNAINPLPCSTVAVVNPEEGDAWVIQMLSKSYPAVEFRLYTLATRLQAESDAWLDAIKEKNVTYQLVKDPVRNKLTARDVLCKCHGPHRPRFCSTIRVRVPRFTPCPVKVTAANLLEMYLDMASCYPDVKCHASTSNSIVFCSQFRNPVGLASVLREHIFTCDLFATVE